MQQGFLYKIFFWIMIGVGFFIFLSNLRHWWQFKKLKAEEEQFQSRIEEKEEKVRKLKELVAYAKTEEFIKSELRRRLGLGEENEIIVIIPHLSLLANGKADESQAIVPTWKAWYQLFVKND